ncbi:FxSxx-COOH system tetratricopeptide repeat protein [Frankia sp. CiP1_Cm_nod2]|uniref:FxSxx-COOH system tetratricopeptide repeat protein n=1 Tax=Frankia sp. CiP1_Cm_nod2 TaxID=2897161 RepID=UPI002024E4EF
MRQDTPSPAGEDGAGAVDFFVSHVSADREWAEWIAWQLEAVGYRVLVQPWDFVPGSNLIAEKHRATQLSARTISVLSAAYLASEHVAPEWQAALDADPSGRQRRLLMLRVEDCKPPGLLAQRVVVDLFATDATLATQRLLAAVRDERGKPTATPAFPGRPEPGFPGRLPVVWNIPVRLRFFTGRDALLEQIAEQLAGTGRVAVTGPVGSRAAGAAALYGLGGVGKTQLAVEYAHRYADVYRWAWWIDAEQPVLVSGQLAALAPRLELPVSGRAAEDAAAVLDRLSVTGDWLLIFDNAQSAEEVREWLPDTARGGHVLVTSRSPVWTPLATRIPVDVLSRSETTALLRQLVPDIDGPTAHELANLLGDLPLAVGQAAAYLEKSGETPAGYLATFRARRHRLLAEGQDLVYGGSVDAAWSLSLQRLATESPAAVRLLGLAAFLGPEPIPLTLLTQPVGRRWQRQSGLAGRQVPQAVTALLGYSLVTRDGDAIRVHRLVQEVTRTRLTRDRRRYAAAARRLLVAAAPPGTEDPDSWPVWAVLAPHALTAPALYPEDPAEDIGPEARRLLLETGWYLRVRGDPHAAHSHHQQVHRSWARHLGLDHPDTLSAANNLAEDLRVLGDVAAARSLDEDTLRRRRQLSGDNHPDTLASANNLAIDLRLLGDVAAARNLDEDTLRRRQLSGRDHPDTLRSASNLAIELRLLGEVAAARDLDEDTLRRRRQLFGDSHPDTLASANNLAEDLRVLGEAAAARDLDEDTLRRHRQLSGDSHPDTLASANNLAEDLRLLGDVAAARDLDEDTLRRHRQLFGDDHPATLRSMSNLAADLWELGDTAGAEQLRTQLHKRHTLPGRQPAL